MENKSQVSQSWRAHTLLVGPSREA